jgi:hypothetical protein
MTTEERFERIEHVTAALVEERRKDREDYRRLGRDTQQLIAETNATIARMGEQSMAADRRLEDKLDRLAEEAREQDRKLGERIDALVSAIGVFLAKQNPT